MDFFCWACYINCIFKYYKIFVTDRYFSKLGLTVSDSDWNIYVMAPLQRGQMQGVGLGTWQQGSHAGSQLFCPELPRQLRAELGAIGGQWHSHRAESPAAQIGTHSPFLPSPRSYSTVILTPCTPLPSSTGGRGLGTKGCSWLQEGLCKGAPVQGSCSQLLPKSCSLARASLRLSTHFGNISLTITVGRTILCYLQLKYCIDTNRLWQALQEVFN